MKKNNKNIGNNNNNTINIEHYNYLAPSYPAFTLLVPT